MAKSQKKSNKEMRKPKKEMEKKPLAGATATPMSKPMTGWSPKSSH